MPVPKLELDMSVPSIMTVVKSILVLAVLVVMLFGKWSTGNVGNVKTVGADSSTEVAYVGHQGSGVIAAAVDSGATSHLVKSPVGLSNLRPNMVEVASVAAGVKVISTHVGTIKGRVRDDQGKWVPVVIEDVLVVPRASQDVLS